MGDIVTAMIVLVLLLLSTTTPAQAGAVTFTSDGTVPVSVMFGLNLVDTLIPIALSPAARISVAWKALGATSLALSSVRWSTNFTKNVPAAVYIARFGTRTGAEAEANITINASYDWYWEDACIGTGDSRYDLPSVILHEVMHVLGMNSLLSVVNGTARNFNVPNTSLSDYDSRIRCPGLPAPSLGQLVNCAGAQVQLSNGYAMIYSPGTWSGASIAHLDMIYADTEDSLMVPYIGPGVCRRSVGPKVLQLLADLGYEVRLRPTAPPTSPVVSSGNGLGISWAWVWLGLAVLFWISQR